MHPSELSSPVSEWNKPMVKVLAAFTLFIGLAATAAAQDALVTLGEKVFATQKCSMCHSIGEKGNKKGPLDDVGSKLTAEDIHAWIVDAKGMTAKAKATRKPLMKDYKLPKEDLDGLVAYLQTLKKKVAELR
ncbi:MAG: cytochrome c [Planctomycetaceae bacterium]|nr:cytochrome c [Planctomycetaceae bacterium]